MSTPSILRGGEKVIIKREVSTETVDDYGNPIVTTTNIIVKNCLIAFGTTSEPIDVNRNPADIQLTVYMPKGTVVLDGDIFIIRETEFVKNGLPADWKSTNTLHSVVIPVRRRHG
jgi:hypothetical protein